MDIQGLASVPEELSSALVLELNELSGVKAVEDSSDADALLCQEEVRFLPPGFNLSLFLAFSYMAGMLSLVFEKHTSIMHW